MHCTFIRFPDLHNGQVWDKFSGRCTHNPNFTFCTPIFIHSLLLYHSLSLFICPCDFSNQTPASLLHPLSSIFKPVFFRIFPEWKQRFLSLLYKRLKQFPCFVFQRNLCNEFCFDLFRFRLTVHFHDISIDDFSCSLLLPRRFQCIPPDIWRS